MGENPGIRYWVLFGRERRQGDIFDFYDECGGCPGSSANGEEFSHGEQAEPQYITVVLTLACPAGPPMCSPIPFERGLPSSTAD
jgi:hypothetical protein